MSSTATAKRRGMPAAGATPSLIDAAKAVVGLTSWDPKRECAVTSKMAVEVLRKAIQEAENPTLVLRAPEPLPRGCDHGNTRRKIER